MVVGEFCRITFLQLSVASSHEAIEKFSAYLKVLLLLLVKAQLRVINVIGGEGMIGVLLLVEVLKATTVVLLAVRLIVL